jgi:hypothetical protein
MEELHKARPVRDFAVPEGLIEETVCADNGLAPVSGAPFQGVGEGEFQILEYRDNPGGIRGDSAQAPLLETEQYPIPCPHTITERFIAGTEPQRLDDWHQRIALDRRNGLRAGSGCPLDFTVFRTFTLYPAEVQSWARKQGIPEPPAVYSPFCPDQTEEVVISPQAKETPFVLTEQPPIEAALVFTSPDQGSVFRLVPTIPIDKQKIRIEVRPVDGVEVAQLSLLINGRFLADGSETLWQMTPGVYTFEAVGVDGAGHEIRASGITVEVVE